VLARAADLTRDRRVMAREFFMSMRLSPIGLMTRQRCAGADGRHTSGPKGRVDFIASIAGDKSLAHLKATFVRDLKF